MKEVVGKDCAKLLLSKLALSEPLAGILFPKAQKYFDFKNVIVPFLFADHFHQVKPIVFFQKEHLCLI